MDAVSRTPISLEPWISLNFVSPMLPAGSVPVIVISFVPGARSMPNSNFPSFAAIDEIEVPLPALTATRLVPAWVVPLIVTSERRSTAPVLRRADRDLGRLLVEDPGDDRRRLGFARRPGSRVAEMSLRPAVSSNGTVIRLVVPTGTSTTAAGSRPSRAR